MASSRYDQVREQLSAFYKGDTDKVERFLDRPHQLLDGARPIDFLQASPEGADVVIDLIQRAQFGFAA